MTDCEASGKNASEGVKMRWVSIITMQWYSWQIFLTVSQISSGPFHTGQPSHLRSIEKELKNFWSLCDTKMAPKRVLGLKEQLIFNNLKLMHQISHGRSPVDFDEFFTISEIEQKVREKIEPNTFKHSFAKHSFSRRIHMYWNYLLVKTQNLPPAGLDTPVLGPPPGINE